MCRGQHFTQNYVSEYELFVLNYEYEMVQHTDNEALDSLQFLSKPALLMYLLISLLFHRRTLFSYIPTSIMQNTINNKHVSTKKS